MAYKTERQGMTEEEIRRAETVAKLMVFRGREYIRRLKSAMQENNSTESEK